MNLPARFAIGEHVNLRMTPAIVVEAVIVAVHFSEGKVHYDADIITREHDRGIFGTTTMRDIDSVWVEPLPQPAHVPPELSSGNHIHP